MNRKITVLVESTQSKVVFESDASTLGELKRELNERHVEFNSDTVFKEAMTKSILASDESPLPSNIPWKGQVTNDLVFMITAAKKKIKSGAMSRKDIYAMIKKLGLQDKIYKEEKKNFTQCSTAVLASYVEKAEKASSKKPASSPVVKKKTVDTVKTTTGAPTKSASAESVSKAATPSNIDEIRDNLDRLLSEMVSKGVITKSVMGNILGVAYGNPALPVEVEKSYDELSKEFDF